MGQDQPGEPVADPGLKRVPDAWVGARLFVVSCLNPAAVHVGGRPPILNTKPMSHISRMRKGVEREGVRTPNVFIPAQARKTIKAQEWLDREFREGGFLRKYLDNEVGRMPHLLRQLARRRHGFRQNNRSDLRLLASIPARLYHRLKAMDPHFFDDNQNLKSLRRDNPDACVYL